MNGWRNVFVIIDKFENMDFYKDLNGRLYQPGFPPTHNYAGGVMPSAS